MQLNNINPSKDYLIFSVFTKKRNEGQNNFVHDRLLLAYKDEGINFKELQGVYKGDKERSIIVEATKERISGALDIFNQESVLLLVSDHSSKDRLASLIFKDKSMIPLGRFKQVTKEVALKEDCYTKDGNTYYITTKE